ncbi:unnamed protein product, partial [Larinioides sclopetarius]
RIKIPQKRISGRRGKNVNYQKKNSTQVSPWHPYLDHSATESHN